MKLWSFIRDWVPPWGRKLWYNNPDWPWRLRRSIMDQAKRELIAEGWRGPGPDLSRYNPDDTTRRDL